MRPVHLILLAALAIAAPAFAGVYECPPGSGHFRDMPCDGSAPPKGSQHPSGTLNHADTSATADDGGVDTCKEVLTDFSGAVQIMAATGAQRHDDVGACMAQYPSLIVSDLQDACRSTVAAGLETSNQALIRILRHTCN